MFFGAPSLSTSYSKKKKKVKVEITFQAPNQNLPKPKPRRKYKSPSTRRHEKKRMDAFVLKKNTRLFNDSMKTVTNGEKFPSVSTTEELSSDTASEGTSPEGAVHNLPGIHARNINTAISNNIPASV